MNKTFVILLTALILSPFFATPAKADWLLDRSGTLVKVDGYVLGDDDSVEVEVEDEKDDSKTNEVEKNRMEQAKELVKDRQEAVREAAKKRLENQIEARKKIQEKAGTRS